MQQTYYLDIKNITWEASEWTQGGDNRCAPPDSLRTVTVRMGKKYIEIVPNL